MIGHLFSDGGVPFKSNASFETWATVPWPASKKTNRPIPVGRCHGVNSLMASLSDSRHPTKPSCQGWIARFGWARWSTESQLKLKMLWNSNFLQLLFLWMGLDTLSPKYIYSQILHVEFRSWSLTSNFELHFRITTCSARKSYDCYTASYIQQLQSFCIICAQSANQGPINYAARSASKTLIRKQWPSCIEIIPWHHGNENCRSTTKY